jgi:enhancing lycopene biosynthesis protein 2
VEVPVKKVAVILSGCGHGDGSETTEAVSTLIALSEVGAEYMCFAPKAVLADSARIARDRITEITELHEKEFDALVFPGGAGAVKHLSPWAERLIKEFHKAKKPIGAICIAPTLVANALGHEGVTLTIGDDKETADEISITGARHVTCRVDDYISDRHHKVLTTPAYMYDAKPHEVFTGIRKMIRELVEMC